MIKSRGHLKIERFNEKDYLSHSDKMDSFVSWHYVWIITVWLFSAFLKMDLSDIVLSPTTAIYQN
jgi:hypothetical protein